MSMHSPLDDRSWDRPGLLTDSLQVPAMLSADERTAIAHFASLVAARNPCVVELGCFIGASTMSLIDGLRSRGPERSPTRRVIHSYDLFRANSFMVDHSLGAYGVEDGGDFRHVFLQMLGDAAGLVEVHAGDIRAETWGRRSIDLLFVDILWDWDINRHVIAQFYRRLRSGASLIHQDFVYSGYPWLPCSMEWLVRRGAFTYQSYAPPSTVVFRKERRLTRQELSFDHRNDLTIEDKVELIDAAASRFDGYARALLDISLCRHLAEVDRVDQAHETYRRVAQATPADDAIAWHHLDLLTDWFELIGTPVDREV